MTLLHTPSKRQCSQRKTQINKELKPKMCMRKKINTEIFTTTPDSSEGHPKFISRHNFHKS
jgi:hypothetical protein